mmetsp:Transcript_12627/g.18600  ORF Transcript_12627/g.18600 Transcript_12627/m.18600 type:complete len:107 (-) Transcript_12627:94-414(-)
MVRFQSQFKLHDKSLLDLSRIRMMGAMTLCFSGSSFSIIRSTADGRFGLWKQVVRITPSTLKSSDIPNEQVSLRHTWMSDVFSYSVPVDENCRKRYSLKMREETVL